MLPPIRTFAPAKVNLSLEVHGRREDGYHELTSLVAFADVGDTLTVTPSREFGLSVTGPTAARIDGPNLIATAAARLQAEHPDIEPGTVTLEKELPVGAGLGGGSSNVAAYLRIVQRANQSRLDGIDWDKFALSLGADVPVCMKPTTMWMQGVGERLSPLTQRLSLLHGVLVNPGIAVSTARVFQELNAPAISGQVQNERRTDLSEGINSLAKMKNDLEAPAFKIAPMIQDVRAELENTEGVRLVRMSGSGSTFFGLYDTAEEARAAASVIRRQRPEWWVASSILGGEQKTEL